MRSLLDKPNPVACGVLAGVLALGAYLSYYAVKFGLNQPPAATGDEPDYDSLGWELAHGSGFGVDYTNAEFRQPYEAAAQESELYRLRSTKVSPIAYRPPLFPFVMSLTNRLFGRQYWGIRTIDALCMALICGMAVTLACRSAGWPAAATIAFLFVVVDTRTRLYGRAILTEAMAALAVAVLCSQLFGFADRPTSKRAAGIGVVFAMALLVRTQFILWLPGLVAILAWLSIRRGETDASAPDIEPTHLMDRVRSAAVCGATVVMVSLLLVAPWMVRNCRVLGEFMPLGSQGWSQLSAAFSDAAWEQRGLWTNLESAGFYEGVVTPEMSPVEAEVAMARHSRQQAMEWIAAHPVKAAALAPLKVYQEFRPRTIPEALILVLSIIGAVLTWRDLRTQILLAVVATCCVSIAATWSVEGRFIVPLLFVQYGLIALGLAGVCRGGARCQGARDEIAA